MGCSVLPTEDGMVIKGGEPLKGATIHTLLDHRIAMAFSIAALVADGRTKFWTATVLTFPIRDFMMHLNIFYKKDEGTSSNQDEVPFLNIVYSFDGSD